MMFSLPIIAGQLPYTAIIRATTEYHAGKLALHLAQYRAELDGEPLELSVSEFRLLARLMQRPGDVATTEQLHAAIRANDADRIEAGNQVRPVVAGLRRKLPVGMIENVRGVGYRLSYGCEQ